MVGIHELAEDGALTTPGGDPIGPSALGLDGDRDPAWREATTAPGTSRFGLPQGALASIGRALQHVFERYSGSVMRRIVGVADGYGVDGLYVTFLIMREHTAWPTMRSEDRNALELSSALMNGFGMLPNTNYMQVPAGAANVLVDQTFREVGQWSRQQLTSHLKREYMALLEEYAERLRPILEANQGPGARADLVDRPAITIELMERFEHWLASESALPSRRAMAEVLSRLFA